MDDLRFRDQLIAVVQTSLETRRPLAVSPAATARQPLIAVCIIADIEAYVPIIVKWKAVDGTEGMNRFTLTQSADAVDCFLKCWTELEGG